MTRRTGRPTARSLPPQTRLDRNGGSLGGGKSLALAGASTVGLFAAAGPVARPRTGRHYFGSGLIVRRGETINERTISRFRMVLPPFRGVLAGDMRHAVADRRVVRSISALQEQ